MKFDDMFCEVCCFSDGSYVIDGSFSIDVAAKEFSDYLGEDVDAEEIEQDWVRFGFAPDNIEGMYGKACWYTCARKSKGSKAVWIF